MSMASISRSAFSRTGTILTMKPGVTTLSVGTIDVTGITIDDDYSIDVSSDELTFTNGSGTRTISFIEDIISGGVIKPELMPDRALTNLFDSLTGVTVELQKTDLLTKTVQIGDVAIIFGTTYINTTGDNTTFATDWSGLALAHDHEANAVTTVGISAWDLVVSDFTAHVIASNPHTIALSNLNSDSGGSSYTPTANDKDEIGLAHSTLTSQRRMKKIVSKEYSFGFTALGVENKIPDQDWQDVYNHLVGGSGSNDYEVALKSDIIPSGNTAPGYEGDSTSTGGFLQMGTETGEVNAEGTIATVQFYTKDPNVINIETDDVSDPRDNVTIPYNVHAEMTVEAESAITNPQVDTLGYGYTVMQDNHGTCSILPSTHLTEEDCVTAGGEWSPDPQNHDIYYQKDASVNFYTGRQKNLVNRFGFMHDGSLMLTNQDWGNPYSGREPDAVANYIKILANSADNSLYYYTNDGSSDIKKRIVSSADTTAEGETVVFNNVDSGVITGTTITGTTINATGTLKINGVEVDLDNLITEFDYWSDSTNTLTITDTAETWDNTHSTEATKGITIPQLGGLLPTDATLLDVVVLLRWRLTSNTDTEEDNSLEDCGTIQLKQGNDTFNLLSGDGTSNFSFSDESYYTPAGASASGDMIIRKCDVTDLIAFRNYMSTGSAIFYLHLNDMESNYNNLILRDFSWGIRLYWR